MNEAIQSQNLEEEPIGTPEDNEEIVNESIVTLVDDEGRMSEFEVIDAIDTAEGRFVALIPLASLNDETGEGEYIILQVVNENGQEELAEIESEVLLRAVADVFQERFQEFYDTEDL